jgi:YbbR domain-containing protein
MFGRLRKMLFTNVGIKIASLVLALIVYAHVFSQEDHDAVLAIPLSVEGLPKDLTYLGDVPSTVRVRIRAKGAALLKLRSQPLRAVVKLEQPRPGLLQRPVTTSDVILPPDTDARVEAVVDPTVLSLSIEPVVTAHLPIAVPLRGTPEEGWTYYGPTHVWPETLGVTGPKGIVSKLDSIRTEEIDLDGRSQAVGETVKLDLPAHIHARTDRVTVRVPIVPALQRTLGPLPLTLPPGLRGAWKVEPESVTVRLSGPKSLVEAVSPEDLRLRASPEMPVGPGQPVPVELVLPPRLRSHVVVESIEPPRAALLRRTG